MVNSESKELILEAVKDRYNFELGRINRLDSKTSSVMSIAGVLVGLVAGFGSLVITISEITWLEFGAFLAFSVSLGSLILSFWYSLKTYQLRDYIVVPDAPTFIVEGEKMKHEKVMETLYVNYALALEENEKTNKKKVQNIGNSINLILFSIILFALFSVFTALSK